MKIHTSLNQLPRFEKAVITVGTFDGVHNGHKEVLHALKRTAASVKGQTVLITFDPHPRKIVSSGILGIRLLNTLEERKLLLEKEGIDHLVVVPFTEKFANLSATEYIEDFLIAYFKPHTIIIGHDHQFGRNRQGNYALLSSKAVHFGYHLEEISRKLVEDITISSSKIREHLSQANITEANKLLGYPFFFSGTVVHGKKIGRTLGYPTANLKIEDPEKIIPGNGIYAVFAKLNGADHLYKGMMSIGLRPTLDGKNRVIEVNIFDFDQDIYGQVLEVHMIAYLREEEKYNSLAELIEQLGKDKQSSLQVLS
ncbi:MAG: bifunctional riboflavin kinase/FAD synthetase [Bacteroidetes bacterium]|nr:bifunctional riboflavin kinase/FAD synthetase [Bacteroidota bacterium]